MEGSVRYITVNITVNSEYKGWPFEHTSCLFSLTCTAQIFTLLRVIFVLHEVYVSATIRHS
jgi:hypothetical protein